jgi:hypothetical protein
MITLQKGTDVLMNSTVGSHAIRHRYLFMLHSIIKKQLSSPRNYKLVFWKRLEYFGPLRVRCTILMNLHDGSYNILIQNIHKLNGAMKEVKEFSVGSMGD